MPTPNSNTNANNQNPNINPIDPNDPYSTIEAEQLSQSQEVPVNPESQIIAKAMQYYNTEIPATSPTVTPLPVPEENNLYNHDYSPDINAEAEAQLNKLYQKPVFNDAGIATTATSDILNVPTPISPEMTYAQVGTVPQDPSLVYESVTYPQANFQDYKSIYNPNQVNNQSIDGAIVAPEVNLDGATYVDPTVVNAAVINQGYEPSNLNLISEDEKPKSRRLLFVVIGLVLLLLLIGIGGYTWWVASQKPLTSDGSSSSSISSTQNSDNGTATNSESSRSTRSVAVVFNDPSGPKPADIAKKDNLEALTPEFLKQNFEAAKVSEDKCLDDSVCGKDTDSDKDGLTNLQEQAYRTNPTNPDSDDDKISDGDEVNIYGIDPTKKDSTNSGYNDFDKIKVCNDPAFKFTNIPNKLSSERQKQLTDNIAKFQLHGTTIASLKALGATDEDLKNGTLAEACSPVNIKL